MFFNMFTISLDGSLSPYIESRRSRSLQRRRELTSVTLVHEMSRLSNIGKSWTTISKLVLLNSVPLTFKLDNCWNRQRLVSMAAFLWSTKVQRETFRKRQFDNVQTFNASTSWPTVARDKPTTSRSTMLCLQRVLRPDDVSCDASWILTWRNRVDASSKSDRLRSFSWRRSQRRSRSCSDNSQGKKISSRGNLSTSAWEN